MKDNILKSLYKINKIKYSKFLAKFSKLNNVMHMDFFFINLNKILVIMILYVKNKDIMINFSRPNF